jgi:Asp-tRNA(Asn)/Glu-tRNA(Gln) amidotransferase A subunit family amidase
MADLARLGAAEAATALRERRIGCEELTRACLERVAEREPLVRAFVDLQPEAALRRARELDSRRPQASEPLYGVPVAIKEIFDVAGCRCSWGTPVHARRIAVADAAAVARLRAAGAVILGTAVSTEYAIAAAGPTTNPHDPSRSPGGSSSGPAAAVAAGMVPLALGSQSIGSIVRPSVYCGVLGLKPTRGAISLRGAMPLARELDHAGPIARAPEDLALACRVLFGRDRLDPGSREVAAPGSASPAPRIVELVGPLRERVRPASATAVERALEALREAGLRVSREELPPEFDRIEDVVWTLICRGVAQHHARDYERAAQLMSPRLRQLIERGRATSDEAHRSAVDLAEAFATRLSAILPPGTVAVQAAVDDVAPPLTEGTGSPLLQGLWTAAGFPALAVPCGEVGGLPVGVQLATAPEQESILLATAEALRRKL